jgi:peptidoglycan/xylan/chitin deacetylase (PgdA/CDA1 family)
MLLSIIVNNGRMSDMKRQVIIISSLILGTLALTASSNAVNSSENPKINTSRNLKKNIHNHKHVKKYSDVKAELVNKYKNIAPKQWGEKINGVMTRIETNKKEVALTFDACGSSTGSGYDKNLIDYLIKEKVPATLFINSRWIDKNLNTFKKLAKNNLFEIENHGYQHRPLSVNGRSEYGISGTKNIGEIVDEVALNENKIYKLTGRKPKFFRTGTAFYDDIAVKVVNDLGEKVIGFNVLGDAGATFNENQILQACSNPAPGSIIIFHMNHPEKQTSLGIKLVIPYLRQKGYSFVKLESGIRLEGENVESK